LSIAGSAARVGPEGRQVMVTLDAENRSDAREQLAALVAEAKKLKRAGKRRPGVAPTFGEYAPKWLERAVAHRALAALSEVAYQASLNRLGRYFDATPLNEIGRVEASHFVSAALGEGYAAGTVSYDVSRLSNVLGSALNDDLIASVPKFEHPKVPKNQWRILQPSEVGPVYRAFTDDVARTMFLVFVSTGMRRKEVLNLTWANVRLADPESPFVHVERPTTKSDSGVRDIALAPFVADELFRHRARSPYRADENLVFCTLKGTRLHPDFYAEKFKAALKRVGITDRVRPCHDLRHSALTSMALDAQNSAVLKATAGHSSLSTTEHYVRLAGAKFPEAAAALEKRYGFSLTTPKSETTSPLVVEEEATSRND
jgi:integrase